jgi:HEAT repeat protein
VDRVDLERATVGELRDELQRGARDDEEPFAYLSDVALALGGRSGTPELLDVSAFGATPLDGETLERLSHHASPHVRGAPLRYLARRGRTALPELMAGLRDGSHIVRQSAVDELEELEVRDATAALRRPLDDGDRDVGAAVRHALQTLADG